MEAKLVVYLRKSLSGLGDSTKLVLGLCFRMEAAFSFLRQFAWKNTQSKSVKESRNLTSKIFFGLLAKSSRCFFWLPATRVRVPDGSPFSQLHLIWLRICLNNSFIVLGNDCIYFCCFSRTWNCPFRVILRERVRQTEVY